MLFKKNLRQMLAASGPVGRSTEPQSMGLPHRTQHGPGPRQGPGGENVSRCRTTRRCWKANTTDRQESCSERHSSGSGASRHLGEDEQEVFLLRQNGDMTYEEIADSLGCPPAP